MLKHITSLTTKTFKLPLSSVLRYTHTAASRPNTQTLTPNLQKFSPVKSLQARSALFAIRMLGGIELKDAPVARVAVSKEILTQATVLENLLGRHLSNELKTTSTPHIDPNSAYDETKILIEKVDAFVKAQRNLTVQIQRFLTFLSPLSSFYTGRGCSPLTSLD